jgi:hypothetical protein
MVTEVRFGSRIYAADHGWVRRGTGMRGAGRDEYPPTTRARCARHAEITRLAAPRSLCPVDSLE